MDPTPSDVHVNVLLTNMSVALIQSNDAFVAGRIFKSINVSKQTNRYVVFDRGYFNRDNMALRAPASRAERAGWKLDNTPTYDCKVWALAHDIPDEVAANTDQPIDNGRAATLMLTTAALIRKEKLFKAAYLTTGVWTTDITGSAVGGAWPTVLQWNDPASTPIEDIRRAKRTMLELTGIEPNVLTLGRPVYDALADHPDILDRIKYGQVPGAPAQVTRQKLAALFEVDRIEVMNAIENTAVGGQANVHAFIGGKSALLAYVPPAPGLMVPAAGYTFSWTGYLGMEAEGTRIKTYRESPAIPAESHEIEMAIDQKKVAADLGTFFASIVA